MSTNGSTTSNGGTLLTVPANSTWNGNVILSGTLASGTGAVGAGSAAPSVTVSGSGGNYADGDVITKLQLNTPAQLLGTLSGNVCHGDVIVPKINVQAGANQVTLILNTGGATAACGSAIGE